MSDLTTAQGGRLTTPRKLLVLDLDETLMFASLFRLPSAPHFRLGLAEAVRRPGLDIFLDRCFAMFQVAVWTSPELEVVAHAVVR
jgi:RNA polymerase II subunit A small phosphatase-like protein